MASLSMPYAAGEGRRHAGCRDKFLHLPLLLLSSHAVRDIRAGLVFAPSQIRNPFSFTRSMRARSLLNGVPADPSSGAAAFVLFSVIGRDCRGFSSRPCARRWPETTGARERLALSLRGRPISQGEGLTGQPASHRQPCPSPTGTLLRCRAASTPARKLRPWDPRTVISYERHAAEGFGFDSPGCPSLQPNRRAVHESPRRPTPGALILQPINHSRSEAS